MDGAQAIIEQFARAGQMVQIARAVGLAGGAVATRFQGTALGAEARGADVHAALAGVKAAVAGGAGGQDAIKHIDATRHAFQQIFGRTDAQQVARLAIGQFGDGGLQHGPHQVFGFANGQPANGKAGEGQRADEAGAGRT